MSPLLLALLVLALPQASTAAVRPSSEVPAVSSQATEPGPAPSAAIPLPTTSPTLEVRRAAAKALAAALTSPADGATNDSNDPARTLARWREAVSRARATLGASALNSARLAGAVDVAPSDLERDGERTLKRVKRALEKLAGDLAFEPRVEAPRPAAFPAATPVGEVAVLDYPSYRMAKVAMDKRGDNGAFWKLFRHIESNEIAMTAPVEIEYGRDGQSERAGSMAFLYASQDLGQLGLAGEVTVVDVPAARVVSIGLRGSPGESRVAAAREELRAWLRDHPEFVESGPSRTMGWNSPMVSDAQRFTEIQIVVRARDDADAKKP